MARADGALAIDRAQALPAGLARIEDCSHNSASRRKRNSGLHHLSIPQKHEWVDRRTVEAHFEVNVGTKGASGRSNGSKPASAIHAIVRRYVDILEMRID